MRGRGKGTDRLLATIMFTDVVGSTELAGRLGDRGWKALIARHNAIVRRELKRFSGRELDTAGDGFFVMFNRPAQAIDCARSVVTALQVLEIQVRAAVHMGEVEVMDRKVGGIAVHAASRVLGMAGPNEILVTGIVRDVVAGADIEFADRGVHELRGVPSEWHLFAVQPSSSDELPAALAEAAPASRNWPMILAVVGGVALAAAVGTALVLANLSRPAPIVPRPGTVIRLDPASAVFVSLIDIEDPSEMAVHDGAVWVLGVSGRTLNRVDLQSGAVVPVGLPGAPTGIAAGGGMVWVTTGFGSASGDAGVLLIGTTTRSRVGTIPLGDGVDGIALGEGGVWVANRITNTLSRIDLARLEESATLTVGQQPVAVVAGQGSIWVANAIDRTIWQIDPQTTTKTNEISLAYSPHDMAIGFDRLFVTSTLDNKLIVADPATHAIQQTVDMPGTPRGIAVGRDAVWVALSSGAVVRMDPQNPSDYEVFQLAGAPEDVAVDDAGVWVSIRE